MTPPLRTVLARLGDAVAPVPCAVCRVEPGESTTGLCPPCRADLHTWTPLVATPAVPTPPCLTAGAYGGTLRRVLLAYKESGRRDLSGALAGLLAGLLALCGRETLYCVPVPSTARRRRERGFDHVRRLCASAARLPGAGRCHVAPVLRALPRPDSVALSATERIRAAVGSFAPRPAVTALARATGSGARCRVLVVDDVVTTGATIAAATSCLVKAGVVVSGALAVAATPPPHTAKSAKSGW